LSLAARAVDERKTGSEQLLALLFVRRRPLGVQ